MIERTFVGRTSELARLQAALAAARSGRGGTFLIVGEPGVGKSRLAEEAATQAEAAGFLVAWGRCWEAGGAPVFWPWLQAARALMRADDAAARAAARGLPALARMFPELSGDAGPAPGTRGGDLHEDSEADRFYLFDALATWLRRLTADRPAVLVLDDLHAADEASLLLLRFLAREVNHMPLVLIATSRIAEALQSPVVADALSVVGRDAHRFDLGGLAHGEIEQLITALLGLPPDEALLERIEQTTEGNPFFIDETVRAMASEGSVVSSARSLDGPPTESVRSTIERRLEGAGEQARVYLDAASVMGREFDVATVARMLDWPDSDIDAATDAARRLRLTQPCEGDTERRERFAHVLLRDTVYQALDAERRLELHRTAARIIESSAAADERASEIVHHYLAAGVGENATEFCDVALRWAARCMDMLAYEEAARLYQRTIEVLDDSGASPVRSAATLIRLADACWYLGREGEMRQGVARAAAIARDIGDGELLAKAALAYAKSRMEAGVVHEDLIARLEEALEAHEADDDRVHAHLLNRLAEALYFSPDRERGVALNARAVEIARTLGHPDLLASSLSDRRFVLWGPYTLEERLTITAEACDVSADLERDEFAIRARMWRICDLLELGDVAGVDREMQAYTRRCEELGFPGFLWHAEMLRAMRAIMEGRFADGEALAAAALARPLSTHEPAAVQFFGVQSYMIARERGNLEVLEQAVRGFVDQYPNLPIWRTGLALLYLEAGRADEARREFDVLSAAGFRNVPLDGNWLPAMANAAEVAHALDVTDAAQELYERILPCAEQHVVTGLGAACVGSASRFLGLLATTLGDVEAALDHFETAIAMDTRMGAVPAVVRSKLGMACALECRAASGDAARARALLGEAVDAARSLGMTVVLAALEATRDRIDGAGSGPKAAPADEATERTAALPTLFARDRGLWVVGGGDDPLRLRHSKGLVYIERLLRAPGREVHVVDLANDGASGSTATVRPDELATAPDLGDAGEVLDDRAIAAYRERLLDLDGELHEAESANDIGRVALLREESEALLRELSGAVGLGGRSRRSAAHAERARQAVTKAVKSAIKRIADHDDALGHHLRTCIRTGTFCAYHPDPATPRQWCFDPPGG